MPGVESLKAWLAGQFGKTRGCGKDKEINGSLHLPQSLQQVEGVTGRREVSGKP